MPKKPPTGEPHPADTHDMIRVRGARENNLKNVNVDLPKRRLTVFTGVAGPGKSARAAENHPAACGRGRAGR